MGTTARHEVCTATDASNTNTHTHTHTYTHTYKHTPERQVVVKQVFVVFVVVVIVIIVIIVFNLNIAHIFLIRLITGASISCLPVCHGW